ncbi:hypothetical protein D7026_03025 [Salinivibrio sp. VYel7]|nr:hypothetical protein WN56_13315 [Salinivibrio sp. KP-1]MPS31329.1 hypothetical protein [Salinivibrio sp. VYel7]OOE65861.1 hypothetical protein BZG20_10700 [Salinivibrio sp. IB868]OOE72182.1 hypothetical protein BZG23_15300 [Salinivibrio sp. ML290]OOE74461.1 hypothetical protein BZG22_08175 [Salinivibrio sp. IB870]
MAYWPSTRRAHHIVLDLSVNEFFTNLDKVQYLANVSITVAISPKWSGKVMRIRACQKGRTVPVFAAFESVLALSHSACLFLLPFLFNTKSNH